MQILLLAQHVSGTIMPIIRSSRVLYKWFLPVVFGAWFSSCRYGVELRVVCPVCGGVVVKALRYYSDGPGIDFRWCHWVFFSVAPTDGTLCPGVDTASEIEYQGFLLE